MSNSNFSKCPRTRISPQSVIFFILPSWDYQSWSSAAASKVVRSLAKSLCSPQLSTKPVLPAQPYLEKGQFNPVSSREVPAPAPQGATKTPCVCFPWISSPASQGKWGSRYKYVSSTQEHILASPAGCISKVCVHVPGAIVEAQDQTHSLRSKTLQSGLSAVEANSH